MNDILAVFRTHYSIGSSLLTLDEPSKAKPGNPVSIFDLSQSVGMKDVMIVDERIDGFLQAYKVSNRLGVKLCYGLKICVCADMGDKTVESKKTESKAIILFRNSQSYGEATRIWNRAWGHEGHFVHRTESYGRADWKLLKTYWTENLGLALPYFNSFLARNLLTFSQITPDLPAQPWVFKEIDSGLPFAPLIDSAIDRYTGGVTDMIVSSKTILYARPEDFKAYNVFRAIHNKSTFDKPEQAHLSSNRFSFQSWRELNEKKNSVLA